MLLSLETSGPHTSLCLWSNAKQYCESHIHGQDTHSEKLATTLQSLLCQGGAGPDEISEIVIGCGPGSFTGLRIGYSFAFGLAAALDCPLHSISSMAACASEFRDQARMIAVIRDARREELFFECYLVGSQGSLELVQDSAIVSFKELTARLDEFRQRHGLEPNQIVAVSDSKELPPAIRVSQPSRTALELARLFSERGASKLKVSSARGAQALAGLEPKYLREVAAKSIAERISRA